MPHTKMTSFNQKAIDIKREVIYKEAINRGYDILSEYVNKRTRIDVICGNGHESISILPQAFMKGDGCPQCTIEKKRKNFENKFKQTVESNGYHLISQYEHARRKVTIKCDQGHVYMVRPNDFNNGSRCPVCIKRCPVQSREEFYGMMKSDGYILHGEYINSVSYVTIECPEGHIFNTKPSWFKTGNRCRKCSGLCPDQSKDNFYMTLEREGYTAIGEYNISNDKVEMECPKGHIFEMTPYHFVKRSHRCPACGISSGQRKLQELLSEVIAEPCIINDRNVLKGLELDIWYPTLNVGVEYQGDYWHSLPIQKERDERKRKMCKEKNITLIEVLEHEFIGNEKDIINDVISSIDM